MLLKSFRLFVSSTFKDFAQERELLQSTVFPALDAYCAARGYQFHAVDLRWGVNEEAQLDQRTAEICLGEVSAAKGYPAPNFLIMIGDRYGWVPLPFAIARDEFEAALAWLESCGEHDAVGDLRRVYQLDENHVIPRGLVAAPGAAVTGTASDTSAYTLRSREDEIAELRDAKTWEDVEARLRTGLQAAAGHLNRLGRLDDAGHQKYLLSLTEQEIIHGLPGYGRGGAPDATVTPKQADANGPQAIAWIRERAAPRRAGLLRRWLAPSSAQPEPDPQVAALASAIRRALPGDSVVTATASAGADGKLAQAYLDTFVSTIQRKLEAAIDARIVAVEKQQSGRDADLLTERAEHRAFSEERRKVFIGRESNRAAIAIYIAGSSTQPLVLYGRSGSGKSALMARAVADAEAPGGAPVICRFIGASAASSDQRAMLTSLVDDLAANGISEKPAQWEDDANKFVAQVRQLLSAIDKPVVIFLDALDQLRKPYRPGWLPDQLPSAVKIVVSVLDDETFPVDSGVYKSLRQRMLADAFLEIEPLRPTHGHDILAALGQTARRRLQPAQRDYIVGQFMKARTSPLYLRVAFEIARGWRSTDKSGVGGRELAEDTTALIAQFIDELSTLHHHERLLVSRTLGYIAAAKDGLSSSELTSVLSRDADVMQAISSEQHGARTSRLPVSVWVRLHRHLEALLVEKRIDEQPLLQFFHRQLAEVARERFYAGTKEALHGTLAAHFDTPVDPAAAVMATSGSSDAIYSRRSLSELAHQLHFAENASRLDQILMSPNWLQQKLAAFGPLSLVYDYEQYGHGHAQSLIGRTLKLAGRILTRDHRQLVPQLHGRLMSFADPTVLTFLESGRRILKRPTLIARRPSLKKPRDETAPLDGHAEGPIPQERGQYWTASSSPDHVGEISALALLNDGRLASGSLGEGLIRLWCPTKGVEVGRIVCPRNRIRSLAVLPDGKLVSSHNAGGVIRIWDPISGSACGLIRGQASEVNSLTVLLDGRLATGSGDRNLRLWDISTGNESARIEGDGFNVVATLPDGRIAAGSDQIIRLLDSGTYLKSDPLRGHTANVNTLAALPNVAGLDCHLVSGSNDRTIRLWDANAGVEIACLRGHTKPVTALAVLPGRRLASGSDDNTVRVWDLTVYAEITRFEIDCAVRCLAAISGGDLVAGDKFGRLHWLELIE